MSCSKAQEVLGASQWKQADVHDAKKEKIDEADAWRMIKRHGRVLIAKGKNVVEYTPTEENRQEVLKQAMGRSGNLRAPSLTVEDTLYIGFNESMYNRFK